MELDYKSLWNLNPPPPIWPTVFILYFSHICMLVILCNYSKNQPSDYLFFQFFFFYLSRIHAIWNNIFFFSLFVWDYKKSPYSHQHCYSSSISEKKNWAQFYIFFTSSCWRKVGLRVVFHFHPSSFPKFWFQNVMHNWVSHTTTGNPTNNT